MIREEDTLRECASVRAMSVSYRISTRDIDEDELLLRDARRHTRPFDLPAYFDA